MSAAQGPYQPMDLNFMPVNMADFQFDSDPNDGAAGGDPNIIWGGMGNMSLDKPTSHGGIDPALFYQQQSAYSMRQYGQITPPNDDVDGPLEAAKAQLGLPDAHGGDSSQQQQQQQQQPAKTKVAKPKKKRASHKKKGAAGDQAALPPADRPKKTTRKARKGYKATTKEEEDDTDGEMKRERFLERNRVAASKCRMKKKEWTSDLESQARDLAAANAQLNACALALKEEVLFLKSECLKHTDCGCDRIRQYLDRSIAGMNPSGVLGMMPPGSSSAAFDHRLQHGGGFDSAAPSPSTDNAFASGSSAVGDDPSANSAASTPRVAPGETSEQEMQAMLKASIESPDGDYGMDLSS
ncbi:MAG: bZIP transcription factor [Terriglobus roseus]|nr:bZIP transcription factor [Terriglobus roseus]